MADYVLRVGSHSAQGARPKNEDRFVVDTVNRVYLVADGMGGQERGEQASGMAAEIIPRSVQSHLGRQKWTPPRLCNRRLTTPQFSHRRGRPDAGPGTPHGHYRRVGVAAGRPAFCGRPGRQPSLLDSSRQPRVEQLTVDHSVAQSLVSNGVMSKEEAQHSPWQHVLHKFLGVLKWPRAAEVLGC